MNDPVSRETPPPPAVAAGVFSSSLPLAERFADLLARDGVLRGLIGPREVPRLWERHLVNCALVGDGIPRHADRPTPVEVCDIGSGAGLPGVVLALTRSDLQVTLVEPLLRRTTFLDEVVAALALDNVEVVRARAEDLHGRRDFDVVTARAVAPLERLLGWSMPLVRRGGLLLAMKGAGAADEVASSTRALATWGAGRVSVDAHGEGVVDPPTRLVRVEATRLSAQQAGGDVTHPASEATRRRDTSTSSRKGRRR